MKCAVEMGSGAMIYTPGFIKIGLRIQKVVREDSQTHRHHGYRISVLPFFEIRKVC
jgi:hypothetical protein